MFKTIVVGFDGSETAQHAMATAAQIADKFAATVHLVHTPQPETVAFALGAVPGYHTVTTMPQDPDAQEANAKVVTSGSKLAAENGVTLDNAHVERGEPADVIVDYATKIDADLIVTGRRGLGALGSMMQGSTSLRVNHLAKCPVLTVT